MSVEKVKMEVMATKEAFEVGNCIKAICKNFKTASADGFQASQDIPAVLLGSITDLMKALEGVQKMGEEAKEDVGAFVKAILIPVSEGVELLLKK